MMHPVGELPATVYWRRRALVIVAAVLAAITVFTMFFTSGGDKKPSGAVGADSTTNGVSSPTTSPTLPSTTPVTSSPATSGPPKPCRSADLKITAATGAATYPVGAKPKLALVVTNIGAAPCVQDLADAQIELRVFSGSARVWGSHDCAIEPGTSPETLPVGQPIRREMEWSGLSSQPGCAGTRTRVSAGDYKVFPLLSGVQGTPAPFSFKG